LSTPADAAVAAAGDVGLACDDPIVIGDLANVLVHLRPEPVVARVTLALASRGSGALEQELAFASYAAAAGAPIVPPAYAHVVERDGYHVTFWRYVEHRASEESDSVAIGVSLRSLHEAVRDFPGVLPRFDRLDEVEPVAEGLDHPDRDLIVAAVGAARERLAGLTFREQPLHGDAHRSNVLISPDGPLWCDLENICRGPVEYDLACMAWRTRVHGTPGSEAALAAYGPHDAKLVEELMPVLAAFLVPINVQILQRVGNADAPFMRSRIEFLKTFV
jgi:Ser/Thr protein kinase RdoA (MazF antagonist)